MKHGFAKDLDFKLHNRSESHLEMILSDSCETKKYYPYCFELVIHFSIAKNILTQTYEIRNTDKRTIYFGVGSHTGFNINSDTYQDFGSKDDIVEIERREMSFLTGKTKPFILQNIRLYLDKHLFDDGGFILDGWKECRLHLRSPNKKHNVIVDFDGFKYVTLWSMHNSNEFVCIEPWCALPDSDDTERIFEKKEGNVKLNKSETFKVSQRFILGE